MAIGCGEICKAACCRNLKKMSLSTLEYQLLNAKGAVLFEQNDGEGIYRMEGDCPNLVDNQCLVHGTSEQPGVCKEFRFMSSGCRATRSCRSASVILYLTDELFSVEKDDSRLRFLYAVAEISGFWLWGNLERTEL